MDELSAWRDRFRGCLIGLAEAHGGAGSIPARWLAALRVRAELEALADRLLDLARPPSSGDEGARASPAPEHT